MLYACTQGDYLIVSEDIELVMKAYDRKKPTLSPWSIDDNWHAHCANERPTISGFKPSLLLQSELHTEYKITKPMLKNLAGVKSSDEGVTLYKNGKYITGVANDKIKIAFGGDIGTCDGMPTVKARYLYSILSCVHHTADATVFINEHSPLTSPLIFSNKLFHCILMPMKQ